MSISSAYCERKYSLNSGISNTFKGGVYIFGRRGFRFHKNSAI